MKNKDVEEIVLDKDDDLALEKAWEAERTPEFLKRIERQAKEDEARLEAIRRKEGLTIIPIKE